MGRKPTPDQRRQVEALLRTYDPRIRKAFQEAIQRARGSIDQGALIAALDARDIERAVQLLRLNQAALFPLTDAVRSAYVAGADLVAPILPATIAGVFAFDGLHPRAQAWLAEHSATLVQGIVEDSLNATRKALVAGLQENRGTRAVAREITGQMIGGQRRGGILGLTSEQTDYAISARSELTNLDGNYFTRKLRDKRFDAKVRRAMKSGKALTQAEIDQITGRYKDRMLAHRGRLIAQNETFTAQAQGRAEAMRQVLARDDVEAVTKRWQHSPQERGRPDHIAMDGTVIDFDEDFVFADARMSQPHDPRGGAKHSAFCKCIAVYRVRLERG
ncbi:phage minor head protein [Roseovarius mucosus]|uniref:phage minor head protein n=1 Tax=Roseovarius mucosus TaxID=215743 RepID=UPI0035CEF6C3